MIINLREILTQKLNDYLDNTPPFEGDLDLCIEICQIENLTDFQVVQLGKRLLKIKNEKNEQNIQSSFYKSN